MTYKTRCPDCGAKLSRQNLIATATIHYQCRTCGAKFRMTAFGLLLTFAIVAVEFLLWALSHWHILPRLVAIGLLLATLGLSIWLLPYLIPVRPEHKKQNREDAKT